MKPVFVAIDTPDLERARSLTKSVKSVAGGVKLGLEFFCANGPSGVHDIAAMGLPVFLDLKLHDIPNTVAKAMQALRPLEPAVVTVHAAGGRAMLEDAKAAAPEKTKVVGVTVLTSLDREDLGSIGVNGKPAEQVERLAALARESGLDGIVCSGEEVKAAKRAWPQGFFVVPGVRPQGSGTGDQKRIVTPRKALDSGASILVIGRPVTQAADPEAALKAIAATL
ncbi:MAG TPA: orotidine-5'-phosphate decarboxylase [Sphingomicrobium sp.]|nr:orotidine-5'-phosphate decarboxylase [Sphingomicrobium sp.]